jgi:RNA polymerase sigma factor (sigma-70 family)
MNEDPALLRRFAEENSDGAFRELVERRIDFVYATAMRQVGGDVHLAQEVAQSVFLDLARKARTLASRSNLTGWLYTSVRFAAAKALRSRSRRLNHETEAHAMQKILSAPSATEANWNELRPVLDEAMHELNEGDREAILLRFFEGRSLADIGATVGVAENTARMRVDRALEKLRARLARRGITSTAAALGAALVAQPAVAAPAGLAASVAGVSLAGAAATTLPALTFMSITKITIGIVGVAALSTGAYLTGHYQAVAAAAEQKAEIAALRAEKQKIVTVGAQRVMPPAVGTPEGGVVTRATSDGPRLRQIAAQVAARKAAREASGGGGGGGMGSLGAAAAGPLAPAPAGSLRMLAELQKRGLVRPNMAFVNPDGKLNSAFVELFALNPDEQSALQQNVDGARERLFELERANSAVSRNDKGDLVISVSPFAAEGGVVYDALMKSFADTLGPERNAAYVALGSSQVERALGQFGAAQRTVTFSVNPATAGGAKGNISVKMDYKSSDGSGNSSSNFPNLEEAQKFAGTVGRLVPPDFGK